MFINVEEFANLNNPKRSYMEPLLKFNGSI